MKPKQIVRITLAAMVPLLFGCRTAYTPQSVYEPGVGYRPATVSLIAPPTVR